MTKKTLQRIGEEAAIHYHNFNRSASDMETVDKHTWDDRSIERAVLREQTGGENPYHLPSAEEMRAHNAQVREDVAEVRPEYDEEVARGKDFAEAHAAELHDLAVIEAHLGGVAINVEQPLEIGQKIEVHTTGR